MSVGVRLAAELPGSALSFFNLFLEELLLVAAFPPVASGAFPLASVDLPLASLLLLLLLVIIILFLVSFLPSVDLLRDPLLEVCTRPSEEITKIVFFSIVSVFSFSRAFGPKGKHFIKDFKIRVCGKNSVPFLYDLVYLVFSVYL